MGEATGISWCDSTFNPWWGCAKVSPGCKNCYAWALDARHVGRTMFGNVVNAPHWGPLAPRRTFGDEHWVQPLRWNRQAEKAGQRRRVFCASMADVFEDHPMANQLRPRLWETIRATPNLDWQLLTKRPENFHRFLPLDWGGGYANVWLGVSAENQQFWNERVPVLAQTPARVRFVSYEPALGPIDTGATMPQSLRLDWIICGGESGRNRRPFDASWAESMRDQCRSLGIAFFFKQHGGRYSSENGCQLGGVEVKEFPAGGVVA